MVTRERLAQLFGIERNALMFVGVAATEIVGHMAIERLTFETPAGKRVRGILTRPAEPRGPMPAIVYAHAHGFDYKLGADELLRGRVHLFTPPGPAFAAAGYMCLALDMPTFGTRSDPGEDALVKALTWHGKSEMGMMLSEQMAGLDYLVSRPDVDDARLWGYGLSMGATLSYWLAALDPRLSAIAHLCCYADFRTMIALNAHDAHGHYLTVPGLLRETDNGEIAGMVAPRPQLICLGEDDRLTPGPAVEKALEATRAAYGDGPLIVFRQAGVGHTETAEMRQLVLDFFGTLAAPMSLMPPPAPPPDPNATPIVSVRGLRKRFGTREILHGLDFDIPPGRIYGLIGHNGAGKTTTLNALLGLTSYEGDVKVLGLDPYRHRARLMRDVAFISDVASLPRFLTVRQLFDLVDDIHPHFDRQRAVSFLDGTEVRMGALIRALSKGMLAQLHLAVVMAIEARLLVLDEPTLGLDITYRKRFYRRLLEDYMSAQRTLLITTHQVEEIEQMLTDVMFIKDGALVLHKPMAEVGTIYTQLVVKPERGAEARALGPIYEETRFGQTVLVFSGVGRERLTTLGEVSTPTLSDLFVAMMTRPETAAA